MGAFEYRQAEEIRDAFARHGVRYLFRGKSGAILLGFPDTTQDADVFLEKSPTVGGGSSRFPPSAKILTAVMLICLFSSSISLGSDCSETAAAIEHKLEDVYRKVAPAMVHITLDEDGGSHVGTGVILSPEGHVLTIAHTRLWESYRQNQPIFLRLSDGRRLRGSPLGWSKEWNIALAKITDSGSWPYVSVGETSSLSPGDHCAALEYSELDGPRFEQKPAMQIGRVTMRSPAFWFATTHRPNFFAPIFSLDGRLVGITTLKSSAPFECCATSAEVIREFWDSLVQGVNLDRQRFLRGSHVHDHSEETTGGEGTVTASDEDSVPELIQKASRAAVRITAKGRRRNWSGFIVSVDGYVATCAHHKQLPGTAVTLQLPDGRDLAGKVLGTNPITDLALIRIAEKGEWPHVDMGSSITMVADELCWLVGYPYAAKYYSYDAMIREPLIRRSRVIERKDVPLSVNLYTAKDIRSYGGDSGGGVLDSKGRLIAIHHGQNPHEYARHGRIDSIRKQWDYLSIGQPVDVATQSLLDQLDLQLTAAINQEVRQTVVQIYCDDHLQVLGAIVDSEGSILTKASELYGAISIEISTGERFPAVLEKYSRSLDLAVLKSAKSGLPYVRWSSNTSIEVGKIVAALVPDDDVPRYGIVSQELRAIPADSGAGFSEALELQEINDGIECVEVKWDNCFNLPVEKGDVIRHVEGYPIPDLASLRRLIGDAHSQGILLLNVGDRISVQLLRGGKELHVQFPFPPAGYFLNQSRRSSGFSQAFDTDIPLNPRMCGAPIVDLAGRVIGIAIASRGDHDRQNHVLPSALVQRFLSE